MTGNAHLEDSGTQNSLQKNGKTLLIKVASQCAFNWSLGILQT